MFITKYFELNELGHADLELGWRDKDSGNRAAIKNTIDELRNQWSRPKKIVIGLFIAIFGVLILTLFINKYL